MGGGGGLQEEVTLQQDEDVPSYNCCHLVWVQSFTTTKCRRFQSSTQRWQVLGTSTSPFPAGWACFNHTALTASCTCCCCCCSFDILCVVRDVADPVQDQRLAQFVVGSHAASHPDDIAAAAGEAEEGAPGTSGAAGGPEGILPQDLLRKYITYAKQTCNPVFGEVRRHTLWGGAVVAVLSAQQRCMHTCGNPCALPASAVHSTHTCCACTPCNLLHPHSLTTPPCTHAPCP